MTETTVANNEQYEYSRGKRFIFEALGAIATAEGVGFAAGALITPFYPVAGVVFGGIGAGLLYGGYKAFQHAKEIEMGVEGDSLRKAKVNKLGRYVGGAALITAGVICATAEISAAPVAATVALWAVGVATVAWGVSRIRGAFSSEPVTTMEPTPTATQPQVQAPAPA